MNDGNYAIELRARLEERLVRDTTIFLLQRF
jgi:hypothetical protein